MMLLHICGKLPSDARRSSMSALAHRTVRCLLSESTRNLLCGSACPQRNSSHVISGSVCRPMGLGDRPVVLDSSLMFHCVCFLCLLRCLPSPLEDDFPCVPLSSVLGRPKVHGIICLPSASLAWFALCFLSFIGNARKPFHLASSWA
jgi:hypothetical protein